MDKSFPASTSASNRGMLAPGHAHASFTQSLAARAVREVAQRAGVEMPICEQVYRVVYEGVAPKDAVKELMSRALKPE